ncbi:unnamed protein product [Rotaria magnacalcarata]|uniref:CCHC-type domain-containing protein n=1 Tax=Rotaria magnacalcarata TaxID=392030 RepID=A0A819PVG8_9BILA|nr:unnamed protein product [Rotaria magnacalcarata]
MVYNNLHQNRYSIDNLIGQPSQIGYNHQCPCPVKHYDPQTNVHFVSKGNHRHRRVPPPLISNLTSINSRTPSKRGSPSSDPDEEDFQVKCNNNDIDFLLYLKNSTSFALLYDKLNWPLTIAGKEFTFPSWPSIPPQLSVIIKNVNINIEFEEFSNEVKALVHDVINVVRMKNKFGNDIHLVKLELSSTSTRQDLLNAKKLIVNYISYDVIEFLSPATVLICSKCSGIGHFRKQCTEQHETCKTCAQAFADPVCKHCSGNHLSNSAKCPVIKSFRAELTRMILNTDHQLHQSSSSSAKNNNHNYAYNLLNFPPLPAPQALNNSVMMKLDELMTKITDVKDHLAILSSKHDKFEQFMIDKTQQDELVKQQMDLLQKNDHELKKDLV